MNLPFLISTKELEYMSLLLYSTSKGRSNTPVQQLHSSHQMMFWTFISEHSFTPAAGKDSEHSAHLKNALLCEQYI